jgi:hypothetical protein
LRDQTEPALDLVEPGRVGRRVVQMKARSPREPGSDLGVLVRAVVVGAIDCLVRAMRSNSFLRSDRSTRVAASW